MRTMPRDAAGAIARMDFVLGRFLGLHGIYRIQVLVKDVTFEQDGSAVYIRRSVEKNDQTGKRTSDVRLLSNAANPDLCPVKIIRDYLKLLPTPINPESRLLRNPNVTKTKLTQQPLGKNGPLRYVKYAASFAGIDASKLHEYGTNSWRKAAANQIAKQASVVMMEAVKKGTFHKTVTATKHYLNTEALETLAGASAQVLAEASRPTTSAPVAVEAPRSGVAPSEKSPASELTPTLSALPPGAVVITGNVQTLTINISTSDK
jgi:hypothetical protein